MTERDIIRIKYKMQELGCFDRFITNRAKYIQECGKNVDIWEHLNDPQREMTYNTFCLRFEETSVSFLWDDTPEGRSYWADINAQLSKFVLPEFATPIARFILFLKKHRIYKQYLHSFLTVYRKYNFPSKPPEYFPLDVLMMMVIGKCGQDPDNFPLVATWLMYFAADFQLPLDEGYWDFLKELKKYGQ